MVRNLVLRPQASWAVKRDSWTYIRWYTSPNENFEYCYPHSMRFYSLVSNWSIASCLKQHFIQRNVTSLMTSNCITRYTVANFWRYPIKLRLTKASALECQFWIDILRPLVKSVYQKNNFLISQPKHLLGVLKRTVSMRRFFWTPKTYVETDG